MQEAMAFKNYNQEYPNNFSQLEQDVINRFDDAVAQGFSSFLLMVNGRSSWHRLFVDPLSRALYSSRGEDFEFIQSRRAQGMSVHDAVYALACQEFGDEMARLEQWVARQANRRMAA